MSDAARKHRVLHLITRLELGGAQQNTLYCVAHHDRSRFEVELIAGRGGMLDLDALAIPDARVELVPYLRHPVSPAWDLAALFRLRSHFREHRIDVVHTHSSKAGIVGRIAAWLARVPVIVHTVHGWSFNDTQPRGARNLYIALERVAARRTHRLVVVSSRNRDKGLACGVGRPEQYAVVHSGIDIAEFRRRKGDGHELRHRLGYDDGHVVVGMLGCLKPQKAPLDFVRAAAAAHAADPNLRFLVAGDGELRPEMERMIAALGLDGIVTLLGWRRDVPELLQAVDMFLLTSLFEGLPRSVLQSMAAGVPVVATAVDGTPEVVDDGETGLLVPPGRPDLAAAAVLRLVRDPELRRRCVENASRRLTREFDIREMVRTLDDLYAELLRRRDSDPACVAATNPA